MLKFKSNKIFFFLIILYIIVIIIYYNTIIIRTRKYINLLKKLGEYLNLIVFRLDYLPMGFEWNVFASVEDAIIFGNQHVWRKNCTDFVLPKVHILCSVFRVW